MLRGGAYTDCAERWNPGIPSAALPLGESVEERQECTGVWSHSRWDRVDPLGWGAALGRPLPRDFDTR